MKEALRSLEEPILPIRAHGLVTLKQLVMSKTPGVEEKLPAIINMFLTQIHDEDRYVIHIHIILIYFDSCANPNDSYIYLNAIKGLSAMTDIYADQVLCQLVSHYTCEGKEDMRLRVGEALLQTIYRCGKALDRHGICHSPDF